MQVTVKFKILPTKEQEQYLKETLSQLPHPIEGGACKSSS